MNEKLTDAQFLSMARFMRLLEAVYPRAARRARTFGIEPGTTIVDYACGPGRYTMEFARIVGERGHVYAVDIQPLALTMVNQKAAAQGISNITTQLAQGYDSGLPSGIADRVLAIDMFFMVEQPTRLLREIARVLKPEGLLIIDDGHQSRKVTKEKIARSGAFSILRETRSFLTCEIAR